MLSLQPPDEGEDGPFSGHFTADSDTNILPNATSEEFMLCRFCAQLKHYNKELLDLSHDRNSYDNYVRILQFFKIDFVDLSEGNLLPKTTCEQCYNSIHDAYKFFIKVKASQITFNNMYNSSDFTVKVESPDDLPINSEISTNVFPKSKKVKSENNESEFPFLCDTESTKVPFTIPLIPETSPNIIHTPSFGDLITDQNIEPKLLESDSHYSDADIIDIKLTKPDEKVLVPLYCGIPIFVEDQLKCSWNSYKWNCRQCDKKCSSLSKLREHGTTVHQTCYKLFSCIDCDTGRKNFFEDFIEHVREHRKSLRNYCKYCDRHFDTAEDCEGHEKVHINKNHVCKLCGELCPDATALTQHRECSVTLPRVQKNSRRVKEIKYTQGGSWDDYEWTCQECCQRLATVSSLREHVQNVHNKCFAMKCVDCLNTMTNFRMFADHVKKHRPYLKEYCQYCNEAFTEAAMAQHHIDNHFNDPQQSPCDGCGQIFPNNKQLSIHMRKYESPRRRGSIKVEDMTCDVCQKICPSIQAFRQHRKRHDEQRKREYTCHSCGKSFYTAGMLKEHIKTHDDKKEVCEICKKKFHTKPKLKAHVATHSGLRPYTCDECGKSFRTDKRLKVHCLLHTDIKPFKCLACGKEFRYKIGLKVHENQHTGLRPYPCERCDKTFANWANCNKHMIRKHGITLAKTKLTALGRLDINRETGQPTNIAADEQAREWMNKLINVKRGRGVKRQTEQPSTS